MITNGYTSLAQVQNYIATYATGTTAEELIKIQNDDLMIETLITDASRMIDTVTSRQFYLVTGTYSYTAPTNSTLFVDRDFVAVVSVMNGSGELVSSSEYDLLPLNHFPKYGISLKSNSGVYWNADSDYIQIELVEGYATSVPADIELACTVMTVALYRQRNGQTPIEGGFVTPAGNVIVPGGIPKTAAQILARYMRSEIVSY